MAVASVSGAARSAASSRRAGGGDGLVDAWLRGCRRGCRRRRGRVRGCCGSRHRWPWCCRAARAAAGRAAGPSPWRWPRHRRAARRRRRFRHGENWPKPSSVATPKRLLRRLSPRAGVKSSGGARRVRASPSQPSGAMISAGERRASVGGELGWRAGAGGKGAGRQVAPARGRASRAAGGDGGEPIGALGLEQVALGQRARRDDAGDGAGDDALARPFAGFGGVLDLFGDGDAVAALDQAGEIGVGGMDGHAAHRDGHAGMLAALGQRDVERGGGGAGVVEEQFVEIAHAEEQQAIGGFVLQRQILRDHRGSGGHRCRL